MRNTRFFIRLTVFALLATAFQLGVDTAQANDAPESASQGTGIEGVLDKQVDMTFQDTHLQDILDFISENYEINIIVDNRVVRPKEPNRVNPDAKYVTDGVISYVNLNDVSLRDALRSLLLPLGLSYSVQQSAVWISTPEHQLHESFEDLEVRFYELHSRDIQNLNADLEGVALEPIDVVNLLRHVVPEIVEPISERRMSYIRFNQETKQLVVYNTPSNHRIVAQVLKLLDRPV